MKLRHYVGILCVCVAVACKQKADTNETDTTATAIQKEESDTLKGTSERKSEPVSSDWLITPGIGIGQTVLNEAGEKVIARLGKPDGGDAAMGKSVSVWYADHNKRGYVTQVYFTKNMGNDDAARVKVIRVSSPSFKTDKAIYTGVLLKEAEARFQLKKIGSFKAELSDRNIFDDQAAGIAFDTDRSGTITGIAVHEKGVSALNAYMAFFSNVKAE
ncbi:hypothetical protein [Mucilaginibacter sp. MD40]|uniref:hypothetical protein n=1 Tax=Mucilaginibacter sp. MD40 TaxID=2029590 RepID=UPI000BACBD1E|nr:hypothetical protein [Mucilaginibacter sp. MD40]